MLWIYVFELNRKKKRNKKYGFGKTTNVLCKEIINLGFWICEVTALIIMLMYKICCRYYLKNDDGILIYMQIIFFYYVTCVYKGPLRRNTKTNEIKSGIFIPVVSL